MRMCADLVTLMPCPVVSAILNPRTTIQLFELIRNPLTVRHPRLGHRGLGGCPAKVIGRACVPELVTVTCSA